MAEWPRVRLGDLAVLYDAPHQTAPLTPGGLVTYLNVGDIRDGRVELRLSGCVSEETAAEWSRRVVPRADDVVFGYEATVGDEVLADIGVLSQNVVKFGAALRDFRNYVHPFEQLATRFEPDAHTARISFQVVIAAADDFAKAGGASASDLGGGSRGPRGG